MFRTCAVLAAALALCGCFNDSKPGTAFKSDAHGHSHDLDRMLVEDAGHYHAALTAHISSKDGNELDVFFRGAEDLRRPVAVPLAGFTAVASTREGAEHRLAFEPAPPDERAGDPKGRCSHFVAKAGWMRADDTLTVTATVTLDAKPVRVVWKNFVPKKYA
ncbi:MAG: hypothetical protein ACKODX_04370, partial [Gemmata sp.]